MNRADRSPLLSERPAPFGTLMLAVAGAVPAFVGVGLLTNPHRFYASYGFELPTQPSLLSEIRGTAGMLVCASVALLVGTFVARLRTLAAGLGSVLYLGYAGGRTVSVCLDGMPHSNLVYAALTELALGVSCVWVYTRSRLQTVS